MYRSVSNFIVYSFVPHELESMKIKKIAKLNMMKVTLALYCVRQSYKLYSSSSEHEILKIFLDCIRTINDWNNTVTVFDGPVTV